MERYSFKKAQNEAERIKQKVDSEEATCYSEAETMINNRDQLEVEDIDEKEKVLNSPEYKTLLKRIHKINDNFSSDEKIRSEKNKNAVKQFIYHNPDLSVLVANHVPQIKFVLTEIFEDKNTKKLDRAQSAESLSYSEGKETQESIEINEKLRKHIYSLSEKLVGLTRSLRNREHDPDVRKLMPDRLPYAVRQLEELSQNKMSSLAEVNEAVNMINRVLRDYGSERGHARKVDSMDDLKHIGFSVREAGEVASHVAVKLGSDEDQNLNKLAPVFRRLAEQLNNIITYNHKLMSLTEKYNENRY
jgi:hypothetical protein